MKIDTVRVTRPAKPIGTHRSGPASLLAFAGLLLLLSGPAAAGVQSKDQQKCSNAISKAFSKVVKAQGKALTDCIKNHAKGKLPAGQTANACFANPDVKGKIQKTQDKTVQDFGKFCTGLDRSGGPKRPDFGVTSANMLNQFGADKETALLTHTFGSDLDAALPTEAQDKDLSKCQQALTKSLGKCQDTKLKEYASCKKNGLKDGVIIDPAGLQACIGADPKGKIAKACDLQNGTKVDKIRKDLDKKCLAKGISLAQAFPTCGVDGDIEATHACLEASVECVVCLALNAVENLGGEGTCDTFDNGLADGSCATTFLGYTGRPIGHDANKFEDTRTCAGGTNDGLPCNDVILNSDCPPGAPTARCLQESRFGVTLKPPFPTPTLTMPLTGDTHVDCGPVDAATGVSECFSRVEFIEGFPISAIGFICFKTDKDCPVGFIDCDGGTPAELDEIVDHNVGLCGIGDDPNDVLNPGTGNADCETRCDTYCGQQPGQYTRLKSNCEGYCEGGPRNDFTCTTDQNCPGGQCEGGDPVVHANVCNCQCQQIGGAPSPPGTLLTFTAAGLDVEIAGPCDGLDPTQVGVVTCGANSTQSSHNEIRNAGNQLGLSIIGPTFTGMATSCNRLAVGDPSEAILAGYRSFFDQALGDMSTSVRAHTIPRP